MSDDIFGGHDKVPSLSFKNLPIGTSYTGVVTKAPELVHSIDFDTREKQYWDPARRGKKTTVPNDQPVWSAVVHIEVAPGDVRAVWAQKPSAMFNAIREAQTAAGAQVAVGGTLTITYTGDKVNPEAPHLNPAKQYAAVYVPPANGGAFGAEPAGAPAAPVAAPSVPQAAPAPVAPAAVPAAAPAPAAAAVKTVTAEQYAALQNAGVDVSGFVIA